MQGGHFHTKKNACGKIPCSNRACQIQGCRFRQKKATAAKYLSAIGLVKTRGGHFQRKKNACAKIHSSNRVWQIQGWSFLLKKSACGKIPTSNRACQILGWSFSQQQQQKALAASWIAATGLVKVQITAASWISTTIR